MGNKIKQPEICLHCNACYTFKGWGEIQKETTRRKFYKKLKEKLNLPSYKELWNFRNKK